MRKQNEICKMIFQILTNKQCKAMIAARKETNNFSSTIVLAGNFFADRSLRGPGSNAIELGRFAELNSEIEFRI